MSYLDLLQLELQARTKSRDNFAYYMRFVNPQYDQQWFHKLIADKCQDLFDGKIKKLMIFVPPQHGKSTIVTQNFPAWCFGKDPNLKIAGCSYSSDLADKFCRELQRNIEWDDYKRIFNDIKIGGDGYVKTLNMFEINNSKGFYKSVGVGGGITGTPVDIGIIDDPIKDAMEAFSQTYRNRVWEWYLSAFLTRLHNESKQILMMTRWHDDDLAGRILKHEGDEWEVISLPAVKENDKCEYDIREIGESLWENRHSLERLLAVEKRSPRTFSSLYQQRPTTESGNIVKREWLETNIISVDRYNSISKNKAPQFFIDTAFTKDNNNDPSAIISCIEIDGHLYIRAGKKVRYEFPEFIRFIKTWTQENNYHNGSAIRVEPKANGLSIIQQLRSETSLNVTNTPTPTESKETRLNAASMAIECGRVILVDGAWVDEFIDEVCGFPAKPHDEYVDLICYAIDYMQNKSGGNKRLTDYF